MEGFRGRRRPVVGGRRPWLVHECELLALVDRSLRSAATTIAQVEIEVEE